MTNNISKAATVHVISALYQDFQKQPSNFDVCKMFKGHFRVICENLTQNIYCNAYIPIFNYDVISDLNVKCLTLFGFFTYRAIKWRLNPGNRPSSLKISG